MEKEIQANGKKGQNFDHDNKEDEVSFKPIDNVIGKLFNPLNEHLKSPRAIAISIMNLTQHPWTEGSLFLRNGASDQLLKETIEPNGGMLYYIARKDLGSGFTGICGIISFRITAELSISFAFKIPFLFLLFNNKWNVELYQEGGKNDRGRLWDMISLTSGPFEDGSWSEKDLGQGYYAIGSVSSSCLAQLHICIEQDPFPNRLKRNTLHSDVVPESIRNLPLNNEYDGFFSIRKITISLKNDTERTWENGGVFFKRGTSDGLLPAVVFPGERVCFTARKNWLVTAGVSGVVSFRIGVNLYLAIMFKVPFYALFSNRWNVGVFEDDEREGRKWWRKLSFFVSDPIDGDGSWHQKELGEGLRMKGTMCNSSKEAKLLIHVTSSETSE